MHERCHLHRVLVNELLSRYKPLSRRFRGALQSRYANPRCSSGNPPDRAARTLRSVPRTIQTIRLEMVAVFTEGAISVLGSGVPRRLHFLTCLLYFLVAVMDRESPRNIWTRIFCAYILVQSSLGGTTSPLFALVDECRLKHGLERKILL